MNAVLLRTTAITFFILLIFSTLGNAQTFQDTRYSSPNGPTDIFAADLNHDGRPDIVATQFSAGMVTVFLNHGNGTFTGGGSATYVTAASPVKVVIADFNGDGHPDIATASCPAEGTQAFASILFGNGDGTFKNHVDYPIPQCAFSLGFMRVGTDKLPSLLIADGTHIQLLRNNGAGVFTLHTIVYPGSDIFLSATGGDYNRDGFQDIAFVEQNRPLNLNRLLIMNGKADGTFAAPRVVFSNPASGPTSLFMDVINTVDVNGDGIGDLVTSFNQSGNHGGVLVFVNTGAGNFNRSMLSLTTEQFVRGKIADGDFRGTGLRDIVTAAEHFINNTDQDSIVIFPATSKTTWGAPKQIVLGNVQSPRAVVTGNFNTDAKVDIAFATGSPDSLHVFLNTTCGLPATAGIAICSPKTGSTVSSPVTISATARGLSTKITAMKAYMDGKQVASSSTNTLSASVAEPAGSHKLTVNAWDSTGKLYQATSSFTVH